MEFYKSFTNTNQKYIVVMGGGDIRIFDDKMKETKTRSMGSAYLRRHILESATLITDEQEIAKLALLLI